MTDTMPVKSENAEGYDRETPCALIEFAIPELEQQAPETPSSLTGSAGFLLGLDR